MKPFVVIGIAWNAGVEDLGLYANKAQQDFDLVDITM